MSGFSGDVYSHQNYASNPETLIESYGGNTACMDPSIANGFECVRSVGEC